MSYSVESSYHPQTNVRLLRIVGDDIPDHVLLSIGRADPIGTRTGPARGIALSVAGRAASGTPTV